MARYARKAVSITSCARCGRDHVKVQFLPLFNHEKYSHYGSCPKTGQPILLWIEDDKASDVPPTDGTHNDGVGAGHQPEGDSVAIDAEAFRAVTKRGGTDILPDLTGEDGLPVSDTLPDTPGVD